MLEAGVSPLGTRYLKDLGERRPEYLMVTHAHYDHAGALPFLRKRIDTLTTCGHRRATEIFQKEKAIALMNNLSKSLKPYLGEVYDDREELEVRQVDFDRVLKEGDIIDLGDLTIRVYETPGHTRDHLSFFVEETGWLFPGEAMGNPDVMNDDGVMVTFLSSYSDYTASLEKLYGLKDKVTLLAFSHIFCYTDDAVPEYFDATIEATRTYRQKLEDYLHMTGGEVEAAVELMTRKEYDQEKTIYQERNAFMLNLAAQFRAVANPAK
jgi:glyoxylase-like metal-dependent hydrolase (beta-lactamase superfamily II)